MCCCSESFLASCLFGISRGFHQLLCSTVSDVLLSCRGHLCLIKSPAAVSPATLPASCELLSVSSYLHVGDEALFDSPGGGGDFIQKLQLIIVTATHDSTNDQKRQISLFNAAFHWLSNVRLEKEAEEKSLLRLLFLLRSTGCTRITATYCSVFHGYSLCGIILSRTAVCGRAPGSLCSSCSAGSISVMETLPALCEEFLPVTVLPHSHVSLLYCES